MKLLFKQRVFAWLDSYDIYDEDKEILFKIEGQFALMKKLNVYDKDNNHIATLENIFSFRPQYRIKINDETVGTITKEITFFKPKFNIDYNGWSVDGDYWDWNYTIKEKGRHIANINKEFTWLNDTYTIDVPDENNVLMALLVVLTIDAMKDDSN